MDAAQLIALCALLLAVLTFVATQVAARRSGVESASDRRIRELEGDVDRCEEEKVRLERRTIDLADENLRLLRKLVGNKDEG